MYGEQITAGLGVSTVIADFDFETFSSAGFVWCLSSNSFKPLKGATRKGLESTGVVRYAEDSEAEVLCLAYNLKDGRGERMWIPGQPNPTDLFDHLQKGLLLEAWNVSFEYWVWTKVCVPKYGWPPLPVAQLRCAMAKSQAFAFPPALGKAAAVMKLTQQKDKRGEQLLKIFSHPREPTKEFKKLRFEPSDRPSDFLDLMQYCAQDIRTEAEASSKLPDLSPFELEFWQADQAINRRGVAVDLEAVTDAIYILELVAARLNPELQQLTGNKVMSATEVSKLASWLSEELLISLDSIDKKEITKLLSSDLNDSASARRVLEIRQILSSASVKKLYSIKNQASKEGRLHNLFKYHSSRTGRAAGHGPQPQNLPNHGPDDFEGNEWDAEQMEKCFSLLKFREPAFLTGLWGDPLAALSGCLRGLFIAGPGKKLVCSDYSAIEAVVLAELAGEDWRKEVFRTHGMIYEMSASKITGIPFDEFIRHRELTGQHHPSRKTIGKVAELASGYQGWIKAWQAFGADKFFSEDEIKKAVLAWRAASPAIVEFWGGQVRKWTRELYGVEGHAIKAVQVPDVWHTFRGHGFFCSNDVLYIKLLSGRCLTYHSPRLTPQNEEGPRRGTLQLTYEGWNTNPKKGAMGWTRMGAYGGNLVENIVQGTARDLLAHAIVMLERIGMPVVLHVHDEIVCEVPETMDNALQVLEAVMSHMPEWAKDWPVKAKGGWEGHRYHYEK